MKTSVKLIIKSLACITMIVNLLCIPALAISNCDLVLKDNLISLEETKQFQLIIDSVTIDGISENFLEKTGDYASYFKFESSNDSIATVDNNGLVSGKTKGNCNIVIKYNVVKNNIEYQDEKIVEVNVTEETHNNLNNKILRFDHVKLVLKKGKTKRLVAHIKSFTEGIKFSVTNKKILKITKKKENKVWIKALKKGKADVVASYAGKRISCMVTVVRKKVKSRK